MAVSILHRVSGNGLAVVGTATLLCWLGALASGPDVYAKFAALAVTIPGRVVLVGLSWAFFTHLASGIRRRLGRGCCSCGTHYRPALDRCSGRARIRSRVDGGKTAITTHDVFLRLKS